MSGFSIDDVRETFTSDITNFLGRIEEAARALLASPALDSTSLRDISGTPLFEKVGDFAHAITGTSSLVAANSLAESARMLEHIAGKGLEEVRAIEARAKEARRIAQHCAEGAAEMRAMLDLELKHDSDEAEWLLLAFREKLADVLGQAPEKSESPAYDAEVRASLAASAVPGSTVGSDVAPPPSQSPAFDEELQVIFREEVRESGEALARHVQAFIDDTDKMVSAGHIERILHGIKGGAGAAGFPEVHKMAEQLRRNFEGIIIGSVQATPQFIEQNLLDFDRMLKMAGAPRLGVQYKAEAHAPAEEVVEELGSDELEVVAEGDLDTMFHDEARDLLVPLQGYLQKMLENPHDESSAKSVERIFHTLKGSASFAGLSNVSEAAAELQQRLMGVVEQTTPVTAGFLEQVARDTNRILRQVNLPEIQIASSGRAAADEFSFAEEEPGPPPSRAQGPEPITQDRHGEFLARSKEVLAPVQACVTALAQDATDLSAARKLEKIFEEMNVLAQRNDLPQFASAAADCAKMMKDVADGRIDAGEDTLAAFSLESNALMRKVDMKPITLSPPPMPGDSGESAVSGDSGEMFSFSEEQPSGEEQGAEVDRELQAIFQEEARELVVALQGHLQGLVTDPTNVASADHVERIYHTLKGAAATVGLKEVSKIAEGLQKKMESVLESGVEVDEPFLAGLLDDTRKLLKLANLPELVLGGEKGGEPAKERPSAAEPPSEVGDARKYFLEEARELCEKAGQLLEELANAGEPRGREVRGELGKLFHRLKGSALVVAEDAIAQEAARLQSLAGADKTSAAVLQRGLARVSQLLQQHGAAEEPSFSSAQAARKPAKAPRAKEAMVRERVQLPAEPDLVEAFNQECSELLDQLDRAILQLEETSQPKAAIETLMRLTHTLKGAVNTIGLGPTGAILHRVESFLEGMLEATILPSMKAVATFLLEVQQDVRRNLRQAGEGYVETSIARVESRIGNVLAGSKAAYEPVSHTGGSSVSIINVDTGAGSGDAESLQQGPADAADRRFIRVSTERLDALMNLAGELVVSRSRLMSRIEVLKQLQMELGRSRRRLMDTVEAFREEHEFTYRRPGEMQAEYQKQVAQLAMRSTDAKAPTAAMVKSEADMSAFSEAELDRYDDVNVLARSLAEMSNDFNEMYGQLYRELTAFAADSEAHGSIVTGIQSEVTRARMVPLEFLFQRLRLPVRDAAAREGKEVRVVTSGEDVNIDKTIADALFGPMLHLVRNAVVHGIEAPSARTGGGKKEVGTLTLAARQESGQIVLEVRDDGNGLDLAALHAKGVSMGIITPEMSVNDQAVKDLVFAAGLSTKATVGNVAGRGVGGNVVRRAVDRLNGSIRVDTVPGKGTAFLITLPLTLAITKALLVSNRGRSYAIPLYFAQHILDAEEGVIVESAGVRRVKLDDAYVTVLTMDELFNMPERAESKKGPVLVLRVGDQRLMLQVDAVLGQEEVVVKSLGDLLTGHPVLAGVTIRGTGELSLILDVPGVVEAHAARAVAGGGPKFSAAAVLGKGERQQKGQTQMRMPAAQRKMRVLFVDDSLSVRKIAEKELTNLGTDVTTAVDGLDAMAKLREGNFDMIFTDLEMPRMHGYDLIRELRFLPAYQDLPIIVVSSRSGQKHQDQARALGCTDYLTKPFNARQLEGALEKYGNRKKAGALAAASVDESQSQDSGGDST